MSALTVVSSSRARSSTACFRSGSRRTGTTSAGALPSIGRPRRRRLRSSTSYPCSASSASFSMSESVSSRPVFVVYVREVSVIAILRLRQQVVERPPQWHGVDGEEPIIGQLENEELEEVAGEVGADHENLRWVGIRVHIGDHKWMVDGVEDVGIRDAMASGRAMDLHTIAAYYGNGPSGRGSRFHRSSNRTTARLPSAAQGADRKSTRLNSSH